MQTDTIFYFIQINSIHFFLFKDNLLFIIVISLLALLVVSSLFCVKYVHKTTLAWRNAREIIHKKNQLLKQMEDEINFNRLLINSLECGLVIYNKHKKDYFFSEQFETLCGYPSNKLMENPALCRQLLYKEDVPILNELVDDVLKGKSKRGEFRINHPNEKIKWVLCIAKSIPDSNGDMSTIYAQIIDITERKKLEEELKILAYTDSLTDLSNRKALDHHMQKALARSKRHKHNVAIMFIDLDDFKLVNDTLGHKAGDELLTKVASRFHDTIREEDYIARIGGDEFIIVFEETTRAEVEKITKRIIHEVSKPYFIHPFKASITLSIGISLFPDDSEEQNELIANADKAMYQAKEKGKNQYTFYASESHKID
ncbi:diguanylate cyclase domain-containing protein [Niallia sp. 03133]|uniref:diguanylate cyclase domain-containing protein n=1 Tax=Niallia sp. 03133 TaxID=3458060 RepID=UPI004044F43C